MSTDAAPADTSSAGALPRPRWRTAADLEGPSADVLADSAARIADGMRRDVRNCTRFERRLHVLDLLHRNPQLLAEVVLELAEDAPRHHREEASRGPRARPHPDPHLA